VRFSVGWTGGQRVILVCALTFFALLTVGWAFITWNPAFAGDPSQQDDRWLARALIVVFIAPCLVLLGLVRLAIWLNGPTLVQQHALWRTRVNLGTATYGLTETTWHYTRRFGALQLARITVVAPTLVVRASWSRRIKLPLACRTGHRTVGGRLEVAWLPVEQRAALADAITQYATAENAATVARFLRHVDRSPVQPSASLDNPFVG
jgi:hypothetical protein